MQEVNHFLPSARDLLLQFRFIPHARLDDLMVSFAPQGGGVGPHFDSYDVFLLQGLGSRRWQISAQKDQQLIPEAPLRILKHFRPEQEWILHAGDITSRQVTCSICRHTMRIMVSLKMIA